MLTKFYRNKKNNKIYKIISETAINANNEGKDPLIQILYQDIIDKGYYFRRVKEFYAKFELARMEDDCEDDDF